MPQQIRITFGPENQGVYAFLMSRAAARENKHVAVKSSGGKQSQQRNQSALFKACRAALTAEPQTCAEIARAVLARQDTIRKHLHRMVEAGIAVKGPAVAKRSHATTLSTWRLP